RTRGGANGRASGGAPDALAIRRLSLRRSVCHDRWVNARFLFCPRVAGTFIGTLLLGALAFRRIHDGLLRKYRKCRSRDHHGGGNKNDTIDSHGRRFP
ncbi:MAG TPA: hypothetical protein VJU59_32065, partial [Paraburkholderia sp.]|uniref:hypothetical protein n=1 Tax=Paraburkholderia sp. TaxID=1926495 RepID=UPI002B45D082